MTLQYAECLWCDGGRLAKVATEGNIELFKCMLCGTFVTDEQYEDRLLVVKRKKEGRWEE